MIYYLSSWIYTINFKSLSSKMDILHCPYSYIILFNLSPAKEAKEDGATATEAEKKLITSDGSIDPAPRPILPERGAQSPTNHPIYFGRNSCQVVESDAARRPPFLHARISISAEAILLPPRSEWAGRMLMGIIFLTHVSRFFTYHVSRTKKRL